MSPSVKVVRTANILVVLGELSREAELFGQLIPIALENGLDLFQALQTETVSPLRSPILI